MLGGLWRRQSRLGKEDEEGPDGMGSCELSSVHNYLFWIYIFDGMNSNSGTTHLLTFVSAMPSPFAIRPTMDIM